jgi:hypothetical protein
MTPDAIDNLIVTIMDATGQQIGEAIKLKGSDFALDVSNFIAGLYFIKFISSKGIATNLFVKN